MSNVMDTIKIRDNKIDFKLAMILAFVLVAISFFAVGFLYAQAPHTLVAIKLLAIFGAINAFVVYYLCKKLSNILNT
ncbi:hypothetical protein [Rheinheimera salexigens]|uniref:Uncharacterized protein n=1 Tax=Rheinheimera salexigens TaxID=1628148 RepID=A0A1E7Q7A9_9GAMM|nr:hypothetical protein [Rheinheimera salexigens]OEY70082.1 hypothetical protein BI198_11275 [Rheinheimera salexigens]